MPLAVGDRLGPYEILEPIGAGGMGEVYRARDSRLGREVAIKVLSVRLENDPQALSRFEREARAVAALSHPNILVLHDIGTHEGVSYAVTELLEGETLRDRLRRSALPWRKATELGAALADGLSAAHSKGIVHRDLKPENIFLTLDGRIKILDFGLAQHKPAASPDGETATLDDVTPERGTVMGTLGYMSPEQVRGGAVEAPSDIFSLGCVLYEMVTGRRAFSGSSAGDTLAAILMEEPPTIADSGKQASPELERVIERCLAKDPAQRFHSAHDLAFALRSMFSGAVEKPASAPPRVRLRVLPWMAAALAILAVGTIFYWRSRASHSIDSVAVLPFTNLSGNPDTEYLSDGITDSLIDSLSELPNLTVMSRSAVFRYKGKEADAKSAGRELGVRAVLTGRILQRGGDLSVSTELVRVEDNSHLWGGQFNRKLADALAVQNEIAQQISDKLRPRLSDAQKTRLTKRQTENPEAYQLYLKGRYYAGQFTTEGLNKGLDYFRQAIALDPNYALAYGGISYDYGLLDDAFQAPAEVMPKAKEAARKALELDDSLAEGHVDMGTVYFLYDFDWPAAEREFERAIELTPNYVPAHEYYSWYLIAMGRFDQGISEARRAVALDALSPEMDSVLGWGLYFARRYDQAATELRKCLDLDPNYWVVHYYLGQTYNQQHRFAEAIAAEKRAQELEGRTAVPLAELARSYAASGRPAEARQALDELLAWSRRSYVSHGVIASVYAALDDKNRALAELDQGLADHSLFLALLKVDPELDSLRSDPRFQDLQRRMKFPR